MTEEIVKPIHIAYIGGKYVYIPFNDVIESLQVSLRSISNEKPSTGTYNIRSAQLQTLFDNFYSTTLSSYSPDNQLYFAYRFLALGTIEEKKIGTMVITKILDEITINHIADFERIFDNDITTWEVCDSFSVRVLGPLIKKSDEFATKISQWKDSGKVWRMRASCVTFVSLVKVGAMTDLSFDICAACIKSSERFVQLGVGCLLREMSLMYSDRVVQFITDNYRYFSREGLRYSIDKLNSVTRKQILLLGKNRKSKGSNSQPKVIQPQPNNNPLIDPSIKINQIPIQTIPNYTYPQPVYVVKYYDGIYDVPLNTQIPDQQINTTTPTTCQEIQSNQSPTISIQNTMSHPSN
ncbi:hypothetical protein KM1_100480 [Entamoeba histolytica HM-3:IMSS]|uniref:DNA alkylation repair enzyme n=5 Tax=Entamoeba histolytica TaxID=5759 RepID=B1N3V0_ENTH1|nr:hypothetical protein, conserved [Entamoeba histolytica HM-1:IMSS]XP_653223.1 hypothetical protein, conserved [Entamoeba histolytica HM-1:IMSS]EMD47861.1 Hypothetical protein EHI5A_085500 [Entamoeba histolytica KU27]EMS17922.1 hypothetical protein KM1_100480 [Entamoeba histolytica HM-3:IMSS]ENY63775.1 hypothetical protein EHI7A_001210 [Entamoeba histolytica HM-1:IMSS-A]GAT96722.1 hypothetical protein conserved [Entamoeba histolytica]EAL47837.1 hypothetical protein, conserved [Entamoeba hist|eukprot:XP_001913866.1 hypothetical protein, conserved [Entamoeba histolytica HM-1:IMSS]